MKSAMGDEEYTTEEVFEWFDHDGSGTVDSYEFTYGVGWICGYMEYEPTEEDIEDIIDFWMTCDTNEDGELSMDEVLAYEAEHGWE